MKILLVDVACSGKTRLIHKIRKENFSNDFILLDEPFLLELEELQKNKNVKKHIIVSTNDINAFKGYSDFEYYSDFEVLNVKETIEKINNYYISKDECDKYLSKY